MRQENDISPKSLKLVCSGKTPDGKLMYSLLARGGRNFYSYGGALRTSIKPNNTMVGPSVYHLEQEKENHAVDDNMGNWVPEDVSFLRQLKYHISPLTVKVESQTRG